MENMAPGTEFSRDFCAWIGPLQLGVVLVFSTIIWYKADQLRKTKETNYIKKITSD